MLGLASIAAHALIVVTTDFQIGGGGVASNSPASVVTTYRYSCGADASLVMATQQLACTLPGVHEETCAAEVWANYQLSLTVCSGLVDDAASEAVAFMTDEEFKKLEPAPLLDVPELDEIEAGKLLEEEIAEKVAAAEEEISNPKQAGQVIEVTAPDLEVAPEKARFLSEYNTSVEKEMVARGSTEDMVAKPAPKELPVDDNPDELPEDPTPAGPEAEVAVAETSAKGTDSEGVGDRPNASPMLAMRSERFREAKTAGESTGEEALAANGLAAKKGDGTTDQEGQQAREGQEAVTAGSGASRSVPNLRPSEDMLTRAMGGGSVDKVDGVESGEITALNSKKWKFASFFNRMKRQVAQNWHPDTVYVRRDPTGKVYGTKDRVTVLEVSLKPDGALAKVVVFKQSGIGFLDDEAVKAFQLAQPFPNPPGGLVDSGSRLITFSFGFHFQVGARRSAWKVFRYN